MNINIIDYSIVVVYLVALLFIAFYIKSKVKVNSLSDYFVAGRKLTLPVFVATIVTTWYGGTLGVVELSYDYGIVNWLTQGAFWYASYLIFALFLAKRVNESKLYTIPDQLEKFYDKRTSFVGAVLNIIMTSPAPYLLSLGIVGSFIFGVDIWVGAAIASLTMIFYTIRGGFKGVVTTDVIQFFLMFSGIALIIPFAIAKYGGFDFIEANVPEIHLELTGTWTTQLIVVWGLLAVWSLVSPNFYQRCYAAKSPKVAQKGIFIALGFWMVFDLMTTVVGLYARAALPELKDSSMALVDLAKDVLPVGFLGLFLAGLVASVMSTADSFTFSGAVNISNDIYKKVVNPKATNKQVITATKVGIVLILLSAFVFSTMYDSILGIIYTIGTIGISALLVPMMAGFFYKGAKSATAAFYSMIVSILISIPLIISGYTNVDEWGWPVYQSIADMFKLTTDSTWLTTPLEPMYPALIGSFLVFALITIFDKNKKSA